MARTYLDTTTVSQHEALNSARILDAHFTRLQGVRIKLLCKKAVVDEDDDPICDALTYRSRPIITAVSITKAEERYSEDGEVEQPDARVIVNGDLWGTLVTDEQVAAMDQALTQIEVVTDKKGHRKLDDAGRPKLRKRRYDYEVFGFAEVAERHGRASLEVQEARRLFNDFGQGMLFASDGEDGDGENVVAIVRPRAAPLKRAKPHRRGKISVKELVERIAACMPATVLGLTALEHASSPRPGVATALRDRAYALRILPDYDLVLQGNTPKIKPDTAAAVLATTPIRQVDQPGQLVAECCDPTVLAWPLAEERALGDDGRADLIELLSDRAAALGEQAACVH